MKIDKKPSNPDLNKGAIGLIQDRVTLRDYFASKAMQGLVTHDDNWGLDSLERISKKSYQIADEMLKQREL